MRTTDGVGAALARVPLFHDVDDEALATLARAASVRRVEAGEWLFHEGDEADALFVVVAGRLRIVVTRDGERRAVREIGPGAAIGELALLTGSARSASAEAVRDCELVEVPRQAFEKLLDADPRVGHALATELARQLQASGGLEPPETRPRVLAVLATSPQVDLDRFAATLAAELGTTATVRVVGRPVTEAWGGVVAEAEASADHVVLVGDARADAAWDGFVRRHGDRVLLVVDASTPVAGVAAVTDLVLIGPLPAGRTAAWLDAVQPGAHHLVYEAAYELGVARVARRVSGRSLGLVLSGGGARGLAHIGVIAALEEAGLAVDRLGGCSMGALVAGMAALGLDARQIEDICRDELVRRAPFNDWTIPRVALIRSRKAERMLRRVFGELNVEELPRPLFTVSADLVSSDVVVHRSGPLFEAVGISMSIPGLVPPVARGRRLLVDGGVLNNLPVDLMHDAHEGPTVAVDVVRRLDVEEDEAPRLPSIMETMTRATVLGSVERAERNRRLATLVISPDAHAIGLRDFKALDRAVEAGYAAATQALADGGADAVRAALAAR